MTRCEWILSGQFCLLSAPWPTAPCSQWSVFWNVCSPDFLTAPLRFLLHSHALPRDLPRTNVVTTPVRPRNTWITQLEQGTGSHADQLTDLSSRQTRLGSSMTLSWFKSSMMMMTMAYSPFVTLGSTRFSRGSLGNSVGTAGVRFSS